MNLTLNNGEAELMKNLLLFARSMNSLQYGRGELDADTADKRMEFIDRLLARIGGV